MARPWIPAILLVCLAGLGSAHAGVEDWELSEIHLQSQSNTQLRYVELVNLEGGCLFPTSTLNLYDGDGALLDIVSLAQVTTCYSAPTYLLLTTTQGAAFFGVGSDLLQIPELPSSGQLCFLSSATRYDCLRWGNIATPLVDLFGSDDMTDVEAPTDGFSLTRTQTTHVVAQDWSSMSPTPRAPNDGSPWTPPDAGPMPDASSILDAGPLVDAAFRLDSGPSADATPDARSTRYLDLDAVGGDCSCSGSSGSSGFASLLLLLGCFALWRRR